MKLKLLVIISFVATLMLSITTFAKVPLSTNISSGECSIVSGTAIKKLSCTIKQIVGDDQKLNDVKTAAIKMANVNALAKVGTYIESKHIIENSSVTYEILERTAGVAESHVIDENKIIDGKVFIIKYTVVVIVDTEVLTKNLNRLLQDRDKLNELAASIDREKILKTQVAELQKELSKGENTKQQKTELMTKSQEVNQRLSAEALFIKASSLWNGDKYDDFNKVIEYLKHAILLDPYFVKAYNMRGYAYNELKEYDLAIQDFNKAIKLDPDYASAYNNRGASFYYHKQFHRAIENYDKAIELTQNNAVYYTNRGDAHFELKHFDLAIKDYDNVIKLEPKKVLAYFRKGDANYELKKYAAAIIDYNEVIRLDPNDVWAFNHLGNAHYSLNNYDLAREDYCEAIRLDPKVLKSYIFRGNAYFKLNQFDLAINDYDKAIKLDPNIATEYNFRKDAYYYRGCAYFESKQFDLALNDFNEAIRLDPNQAVVYGLRGLTHYYSKKFTLAIKDFNDADRINPNNAVTINNRGNAYIQLNKTYDGCADLKKACSLGYCESYNLQNCR